MAALLYAFNKVGLFCGGDLHNLTGQLIERAVVYAQRSGGLGVDGDDAAVHNVVGGHGAGFQHVQRHIGGVGAQFGIVDAAGGESAGGDEAVGTGVERDARIGQRL